MQLLDLAPETAPLTASSEMLLAILDQSPDCIKILGADGCLTYMNRNGQCAMEIDDFCAILGQEWARLWPEESRHLIVSGLADAKAGATVRFQAPCPTAKGTIKWWDVTLRAFDTGEELGGFISISRDITELMLAREAADAIAAEMSHRLRNAYGVAGILLSSFAKGDPETERFASDMRQRLGALAAAQTLQQDGGSSPRLPELLKAIISPYATPTCTLRFGDIPDVELEQADVDALAMVLGELCVNSAKHGALGANGEIVVSGDHDGAVLRLTWRERSDRTVQAISRQNGQGMQLMRRVLAARHGEFEIHWQENGLTAELRFARIG